MLIEALLAVTFEIGPFYEQRTDFVAFRPFWASEGEVTDVLWPVYTQHRDWWRACMLVHYQNYEDRGYQFEIDPIWWNGVENDESYFGLFPLFGYHPHFLLMYDCKFALWPLWHQYKMPREREWMTTNSILFPFIHWRSDGSWGFWPVCGVNHQRESDHYYTLWPIFTWAKYRKDRDTSGEGYSAMFWPLLGRVSRERESQWMFLPPLFSHVNVPDGWRGRYPWPIVEIERRATRDHLVVLPFYEHDEQKAYSDGKERSSVTRFGWKLVELYDEETRVFPFWVSRRDDTYFRLWPFYESAVDRNGCQTSRILSIFPIRWVPAVNRNWSKFWTFYETIGDQHSLLWGIIQW